MKTIYLAFFLLIISSSFASPSFRPMIYIYESGTLTVQHSKADTKAFVKGFFEGIGATHVFSEIQSCLVDSEQVFIDIGIGITDIQTKNPEKVKEGIKRIGQAVNIIPNAALLCQAADKDVQKIVKIINTFTHPVSLIFRAEKSLLINRVEVFKEIMHVIDAYQKNDYEDLGYWTGKAMVTIFLKSPPSQRDAQTNIHDLVDSFFEGAGKALVFDQLTEDPISFLINTGKNMLANQEKIMLRANNVVDAYNDEDFSQLGYWIGRTVSAILMDQDEERRQEDLKALEHIES